MLSKIKVATQPASLFERLKDFCVVVWDKVENVFLSLNTYEDIVCKFISNNPRTTIWIWLGTLYLTWRVS